MADQGLLGQSKPAGTTNTVLYTAPVDQTASAVLTIANDGTGAAYDVGIKDFNQKLTLDASTYKLHEGDIITGYRFTVDTAIGSDAGFNPNSVITSVSGESKFTFESFYIPPTTTVYVKDVAIRPLTVESLSGAFSVGDTLTTGTSPNDTTTLVYAVSDNILHVGPSTINGSGAEFADGDSVTNGSATATISTGGVGTGEEEFVFSTTTSGGIYNLYLTDTLELFADRTYRFDISHTSMTGRDFSLSETINGEWGPDNTAGNSDDGTEYATNKTTSGTAGDGGSAYIQFAFGNADNVPTPLYFYDGGTGTAANANYGGSDRSVTVSENFEYLSFFVFDIEGTWTNSTDTFTVDGTTYTLSAQTAGPYGMVRSFSGTTLTVIKGIGSADFAGTDTFRDVPASNDGTRALATVSSVDVASNALEVTNYLTKDKTNAANNVDRLTSLVIGPGQSLIVESATQNNIFSLVGFQDNSTVLTKRVFGN
ncbi:structural protein [Synechococcus phage ACG-2014a]|uniref:Structural protein n=1 Tax=Synechococcus phage ACG-2014a TaxID=1493507 RepID=A0A0E3F953_9CAUD|nr:structural protein [Synechococcus phage ACG-2014a]